ncbi:hypothetical protein B0J17DRAFT_209104 [Rhizoctonia solani]|nr:hypothetical protein B0J17DRAFT_209104 [Rhizoctonia solani]
MENFPGPRYSTPDDLSSLKHVLSSNAIDALTSEGSTPPMSVQQIQTHLKSLESFSNSRDVHQTYAVARFWNLILQSRVINKYGTPEARQDRFISITDNPPAFAGTYASVSKLMFNRPHAYLGRCSRAWADRIAYTEEWRGYKSTNEREWKQTIDLEVIWVSRQVPESFSSTTCSKPKHKYWIHMENFPGPRYSHRMGARLPQLRQRRFVRIHSPNISPACIPAEPS